MYLMEIINQQNQLLNRIRAGKRDAVKELYQMAFHYCASFVTQNSGNLEDAREIFQESLFVLLKNAQNPDFQIDFSLKGYLYVITKNLWLKQLRKKKEAVDLVVDDPTFELNIIAEDEIEDRKLLEARHQLLYDCMKKLREDCQKLLEMTFYQKLNDKEIAPLMDYSIGFVRQKRKRCIGHLRKLMVA